MRTFLVIILLIFLFKSLAAQRDFVSLDQRTYDYYIRGDYQKLRKTADTMLAGGMDYYFLRMRLGITEFNKRLYSSASKNFEKALNFNSLDTISQEYIYYCYLLSGREADANLYLLTLKGRKVRSLEAIKKPGLKSVFAGTGLSGSDVFLYTQNSKNYETIRNSFLLNAGFETYLLKRLKATIAYTNFRKNGTRYSPLYTTGKDLNFVQNQVYGRLAVNFFPGWEVSGFGQLAIFSENAAQMMPPYESTAIQTRTEFTAGGGVAKYGWKIRTGINLSVSNFSKSVQKRGEAYLTFLPFGNLNLYLTSGGMIQNDMHWGNTWQVNEELGVKLLRYLWLEPGLVLGNSFLYARNQGYFINNSYLIPQTTVYCNIIISPRKRYMITLSPYFCENKNYSWDLNVYNRTGELNPVSYGVTLKLSNNIK